MLNGIDYFRIAKEIAEESRPPLEPVVPVWVLDDWADAPPAPANPPKPAPLWETWAGDLGGFSESRIRACIHWALNSGNEWYPKNLTGLGFVRRAVHKLNDDTPPDYQIPPPKPPVMAPDPACPKCHGCGQGKTYFVTVPGQRAQQNIVPSCDCLRTEATV
jgi:hypothetical protein